MLKFRQWLINLALKHLFPIVEVNEILTSGRQGQLFLGGVPIEKKKLADLQHEVRLFRNTAIWGIISNTLKHQAQLTMFTKSQDYQDLMNGKMILYTIDVQENIIAKIENAKN